MMRNYKFRAWEKYLEEIIPVHDIDFDRKMINTNSAWRMFNEVVLIQFTGLYDCSGKEIFESDLVNDNVGIGLVEFLNGAYRVNYRNGTCKWFIDFLDSEKKTLEVIGNKFEMPDWDF
jgi:uncharacterized phage protein (TIGR01671 family)